MNKILNKQKERTRTAPVRSFLILSKSYIYTLKLTFSKILKYRKRSMRAINQMQRTGYQNIMSSFVGKNTRI